MKIISVIHARGGSKRIPLKNLSVLGGKPLIYYVIKAAMESKYAGRVIVSTDHSEIKKFSLECGAEVPFGRPRGLAEDCPSELVTKHAVNFVESEKNAEVDIVITLQPTAPFLLAEDIDACMKILLSNPGMNSVFSAKLAQERPEWMFWTKKDNYAEPYMKRQIKGEIGVFQSLPGLVVPNGAVYVTRRRALFEEDAIISKRTGVYVMPFERSVDIDEPINLDFAEFLISRKR